MNPSSDSVMVFDREFLSGDTGAGSVERTNSDVFDVKGNALVIVALLINSVGLDLSNKLVFLLEGTYDGKTWYTASSTYQVEFTANIPGSSASATLTGVSFSSVRLRATINGVGTTALFSAWISSSRQ